MVPAFREIAHGVYSLTQPLGEGGHVHAFLCDDGSGELTLIDTLYDRDAVLILEAILRIGKRPSALRLIAITHAHRSHMGGMEALKRVTGTALCAHTWEAEIIEGRKRSLPVSWVPEWPPSIYAPTYPYQFGQNLNLGKLPPVAVERALGDGDRLGPLTVVGAPGHTPGHLAFHWAERGIVFAGDAVATWPRFDPGWPAFILDPPQNAASIGRMAGLQPQTVAVGHGEPVESHAERRLRSLVDGTAGRG